MRASELVARWRGMSSVSGSRLMTTPAACVEALRETPSSWRAVSTSLWMPWSLSYISRKGGASLRASSRVVPSCVGMALAMRSTSL